MGYSFRVGLLIVIVVGLLVSNPMFRAFSQCGTVDFTAPSTACIDQNVNFSPSGTYLQYDWDFCAGELSLTPAASVLVNSFGGQSFKVELAEQNGFYFGFLLAKATSKLYRLDFGTDINNQPTLVDLGGLGVNSTTWRIVDIVTEGNVYYGFIVDANVVYRITFGTSLTSLPGPAQVMYTGDPVSSPIDMTIVEDGSSKFMFIANLGNSKIARLSFGTSFAIAPASLAVDYISTTPTYGISFMKECDTWYAFATSLGKIHRIVFNTGLTDTNPTITDIPVANPNVGGIAVVSDNNQYYAFTQEQTAAAIYRVNFGSSLANTPGIDEMQNIGYSGSDFWALAMYKVKSDWLMMVTEGSGPNIYRIKFPSNCFSSVQTSSTQKPIVKVLVPGDFQVALRVLDASGHWLSKSHSIHVNNSPSPDIDFSSQNVCVNNNVNFNAVNTSGNIVSYNWYYGDAATGTGPTTSHIYSSAANYIPSIVATASNGCSNYAERALQIFNVPIADFSLPAASPVCTNQNYPLSNTSLSDSGSNPAWEWRLNGALVSTQQNYAALFTTASAQEIRLKAMIPGCENEVTKNIGIVLIGPLVNFSANGNCLGSATTFNNTTVGTVTGFAWNFGDGVMSGQSNIAHTYSNTGTFQAILTASNAAGCQTFYPPL